MMKKNSMKAMASIAAKTINEKRLSECECVYEYNDDHHGAHVYQCEMCAKAECKCGMDNDCCCSDLNQR